MATYSPNVATTPDDCVATYLWDVALAETLLPGLHLLEVAYRNVVHDAVGRLIALPLLGTSDWLYADVGILDYLEAARVVRAKEDLNIKSIALTETNLVDELTPGFWVNLLSTHYESKWPRIMKTVFPHVQRVERNRAGILMRMTADPRSATIRGPLRSFGDAACRASAIRSRAASPKQLPEATRRGAGRSTAERDDTKEQTRTLEVDFPFSSGVGLVEKMLLEFLSVVVRCV